MNNRAEREREKYDKGFDEERKIYSQKFGYSNSGYAADAFREIIINQLKQSKDKNVLELGSTSWLSYLDLYNYAPDNLTCINVSETELQKGIVGLNGLSFKTNTKFNFTVMDAHQLQFDDETFDVVFGSGILHHLNLELAINEIHRVLKKGGICVFAEPMGCNPVGKIIRKCTPKARTIDEKPLTKKDLSLINKKFQTRYRFSQLLYVPFGIVSKRIFKTPYNILTKLAYRLDGFLEKTMPFCFKVLYRYILISGKKL